MMRLFKALFGGIASFFGILFGGLISSVAGAFQSVDDAPVAAAAGTVSSRSVFVDPTLTFTANGIPAPRPNRRQGPGMRKFQQMAKDMPLPR